MKSAEEELLEAIRSGSNRERERGCDQLCELFLPRIRRYFAGKRHSYQDQEDLTQKVLLLVSKSMEGFQGCAGAQLRGWIYKIAERVHKSWIREKKTGKRAGQTVPLDEAFPEDCDPQDVSAADPLAALLREEVRRLVRREVADLPKQARRVAEFRYVQGLRLKEIALAMNLKPDTVKAHLYQVRRRVRAKLAEKLASPGDPSNPPEEEKE